MKFVYIINVISVVISVIAVITYSVSKDNTKTCHQETTVSSEKTGFPQIVVITVCK